MPPMTALHERPRLLRYAIVAAIVLVVGGLFVQREVLGDDEGDLGMLEDQPVAVGEPVPDFALETPDGEVVRLSDFRGQTVVLNFWATWCGPCRQEMPELEALYEQRRDAGDLMVLAVDLQESASQVTGFLDEFDLALPTALDRTGEVGEHFGLPGLPASFFIDADGILRARTLGPVVGGLLEDGVAAAEAGASGAG